MWTCYFHHDTYLVCHRTHNPSFAWLEWASGSVAGRWYDKHPSITTFTNNIIALSKALTLTYWFSWIFRPFTRNSHAEVSNSMPSTESVRVVRTLFVVLEPVADSSFTFRMVVDLTLSPRATRLYTCHMSSGSSGTSTTWLSGRVKRGCDNVWFQQGLRQVLNMVFTRVYGLHKHSPRPTLVYIPVY